MNLVPLTLAAANDFVAAHHRHHRPVVGHRFSIGAQDGGVLVGAATGWKVLYQTKERPKGWDTPSRRRATGEQVAKQLWEAQGD